jgi:hypothetical protein
VSEGATDHEVEDALGGGVFVFIGHEGCGDISEEFAGVVVIGDPGEESAVGGVAIADLGDGAVLEDEVDGFGDDEAPESLVGAVAGWAEGNEEAGCHEDARVAHGGLFPAGFGEW